MSSEQVFAQNTTILANVMRQVVASNLALAEILAAGISEKPDVQEIYKKHLAAISPQTSRPIRHP
jgi:hypothetical protein